MKLLLAIALIASSATLAKSQLEDGSVLIVTYSPDEIVMAADSRVTNVKTGQFRDNYCKLSAPGGKVIFGTTGLVESIGGFDSTGLFRRIIREMGGDYKDGFVEQIATRWADAMDQNYAKMPSNLVEQFIGENSGNRALDCTMFAGVEPSGSLALVRARLFYGKPANGAPAAVRYKIEVIPLESPTPGYLNIAGCGNIDILQQFTPPKTQSNQAEVEQWKLFTGDVKAQIAVRLVNLTIAREKPEPFGGHEVVPVGGPVDAAEIQRGGIVKWIQRKPSCPAN
ncbi:MAG: hypothetical protein ACRD2G_02550 [Terriglobia bacterium]